MKVLKITKIAGGGRLIHFQGYLNMKNMSTKELIEKTPEDLVYPCSPSDRKSCREHDDDSGCLQNCTSVDVEIRIRPKAGILAQRKLKVNRK